MIKIFIFFFDRNFSAGRDLDNEQSRQRIQKKRTMKKEEKRRKRGLTEREKGDILRKLSCRGNPTGRLATEPFPGNGKKKTRKKLQKRG